MQNKIRNTRLENNGIVMFTLDVSTEVEEYKFEILRQSPHGIPTYTYLPFKNFKIVSVVEKSIPIWSPKVQGEVCTKVTVCIRDGPILVHIITESPEGKEASMYYVKEKKSWREVTLNTFYSLFNHLALNKSVLEYVTLNIGSMIDRTHFSLNSTPDKPFKIIVPYPGYVLSRVFDGINTIWKSRFCDDHCTYVNIFYNNKKPILIHLAISKRRSEERLFFKKVLMSWKQISKDEYIESLNELGFDLTVFNNHVTFDFSDPDKYKFVVQRTYNMDIMSEIFSPLPGYSVKRVVDDERIIWESNTMDQCIFARFYSRNKIALLCHLLVTDSKENKILYFMKDGENWSLVDKRTFYYFLSNKDDPIYTHRGIGVDKKGDRKLLMSHFRNKQGLLIRTYCCKVDNPKGNIILIHGSCGHFKSQFCSYDMDWHYERFGYPILPYMKDFTNIKMDSFYKDLNFDNKTCEVYKDVFGWSKLDGIDAFEISPRFQYNGTFLESLNNMGFNVYGMDSQSHGLSESVPDSKFYINEFKDYVNDVLQFVDIVKRGNFESTKEEWNEDFVYSVSSDNVDLKCYLSGFSLGGNIAILAVQEFHKNAKPGVRFVDGLFILSGVLNIDNNLDTFAKKFTIALIKFTSLMTPRTQQNPLENSFLFSDSFEMFSRYKDPTFYNDRLFYKTVELLFGACKDILKNMKYYPDKLPTLFIHVSDDPMCDVNGQRNVVYNYLKDKSDVKLVELKGNTHHLVLSHIFPNVMPIINDWVLSHSSKSSFKFN
uniref:Serine aminopeptidase S33 domain-containing protein n=1 Tax=Theileria annulata TaxID=5874 RepID=A0A3B0MTD4_THEAN